MDPTAFPSVEIAVGVAVFWMLAAALSLFQSERLRLVDRVLFPAAALASLVLAVVAVCAIAQPAQTLVLPLGLPGLPFHLRLDPLGGFFLFLIGIGSAGISIYAAGYFERETPQRLRLIGLQYHAFLAAMALVVLADDAYLFMVAWESMAIASYFLVTTDHRLPEIRSAGFLYLLIAHIGAIALLLCFGILQGGGGLDAYTFDALRRAELTPFWATIAFVLAFAGFGAKAGMMPLHAWLPEAHPAAPSPVSALMSGIMLKTAIYGMVRVFYDLIGNVTWQWGLTVAITGALTAMFGVLYALMQHDLKRLLAYHSVENIGIILIGIGLSMVFIATGHPEAGALGLIAGLYHTLNHAIFKGLLFLGAGSILHATGLRDLNDMGGLIRRMPATATYFLVGALAISALPPLNGFVSEWLTYQTALQAALLSDGVLRSLVPLLAAMLALAGALTAMCFVKVYGIAFLGQPREPRHVSDASHRGGDAGFHERIGMAWLALWCVVLGIFPSTVVGLLDRVAVSVMGSGLPRAALDSGWLWLVPARAEQASYSPVIFLITILVVFGLTFAGVRWIWHGRLRRSAAWDCGFPEQSARMQDTAAAFGQPIRWIFGPIYRIRGRVPAPDDPQPRFELQVEDRLWYALYLPVARMVEYVCARVGLLQQGRISIYLLYSFVTLIALLLFVR
ncbi:MAG: hydrogenase 4 subunit B [Betaproteobacteria bacterium]|nr:hydrogenase 4 subunit B [Betaproteobacteria bacterium]